MNGFFELYLSTFFDFLISARLTIDFGAIDGNFKPYSGYSGEIISLTITAFTVVVGVVGIILGSIYIIF